jgi:polyribonucleotide nucleotidyltransferase
MGKVQRITDFGAFVEIMPGVDGLLHVSEIANCTA